MAKSNGTPMQKRARAANQTAQKVQAAANRARRQVEPAAERPGIGEDGGARPQQVPSTDSSGRAAGTATGGGGSGGGGAPGATKSAGQTRRRQDKIMPNGARKLKKGKKSVHVGVSGAGAGSAQKSDGECSDTAGVFDMTDSDDDECLPSRGKRRVKSGAATPRATSGYRTLPAVKRARNGSTGGGGSQESPSSNKKRKGGDPPATVAATLASPVATGVLSQQSPNKGHSSSGGGGGGGGGTTSSRNTSSGSSSSGGRNGAESCGSAAMEPSVDDQGGPDEEEGTGSAGARTDAVLAPAAPNTPPRGKGKGKGKARRTTGRGAPSVTPTAPHDVDSEGRTASGNDNIGLGLEQDSDSDEWFPAENPAGQAKKRGTATAAAAAPKRKRPGGGSSSGGGGSGGGGSKRAKPRSSNSNSSSISIGGGGSSSSEAGAVADPTHPSDAQKELYRHHAGNETVILGVRMNERLKDANTRDDIAEKVLSVLAEVPGSDMELKAALRRACREVARTLLGAEELPAAVSPFFLDARLDPPERGASLALVGFMCPAHEDNVSFSGESENRTIALHRLIESAVVSQGHDRALSINANAVRCLKSGDGSYAKPCARDENVDSVCQLLRAIYFAALHAYGVKITRIVQCSGSEELARGPFHLGPWSQLLPGAGLLLSLSTTPFFSAPHLTATKVSSSYHQGLAARVGAQIVQARLGEKRSRLSDDGKAVFESVRAGTGEPAFAACPEDIGPPTPTSGFAASEQAISNLRSSLEESLCDRLGSREAATSVVSRLFTRPSDDEAKRSSKAAREANATAFEERVTDQNGVRNSGVAGSLRSGHVVVDGWMPDVCDSNRLIERPGSRGQRVAHTWHMNSFVLGRAGDGSSAPQGEAARPGRDDLLDDDQARARLDEALLLNRQGVTDGAGRKQAGYNMPSTRMEPVGRAVCKDTLVAAVTGGGVRAVVDNNGAGDVGDPDLLTMFVEEGWGHVEATGALRHFFLSEYGCSFRMGDKVGSPASTYVVFSPGDPGRVPFLLYTTGGQASYLATAQQALRGMGQTAGVIGAGEDAVFAHFLGRFAGAELVVAALASGDGRGVDFADSNHGALYRHGATGVVHSLTSSAGGTIWANSCNVADCPCKKGGEECTCAGHAHQSNASVGGTASWTGQTAGWTVKGAEEEVEAAEATLEAATTEEDKAAAQQRVEFATVVLGEVETARERSADGGATLGTGKNQVGSAPSDGAASRVRKPIPGQRNPVKAHGFCFGFGAGGVGLPQKLLDKFAGDNGVGCGPILEGGCEIPNFSEAGVTKGRSTWQLDEHDNLILPPHNGNKTDGHPRCVIGGCVPVEKFKVDGSWRLCSWALPYVSSGSIVQKNTQNQRHNGAGAKWRATKKG